MNNHQLHVLGFSLIVFFFCEQDASSLPSGPSVVPFSTNTTITPSTLASFVTDPHLWAVLDPDIARDNPVEDKHRRLVRSHRSSPYDRELKPNANTRDELGVTIFYISWTLLTNIPR